MFYKKFRLFMVFCISLTAGVTFAQVGAGYKIIKNDSGVSSIEFNVNAEETKLQEDDKGFTLVFPSGVYLKIDEKDFINETKDFFSNVRFKANTITFKLKPSYNITFNDLGVRFLIEIFPDANKFFDESKTSDDVSSSKAQKAQSLNNPMKVGDSNTNYGSEKTINDKRDPNLNNNSIIKTKAKGVVKTYIISTDISSDVAYTSFKRGNYLWLIFNSKDLIPRDKFSLKLLGDVGTIISTIQGDYSIVILELFDNFVPSINDSFGYYDIILAKEDNVNYSKIDFIKDRNTLDPDAMFIPLKGDKQVLSLIDPIFEDVVNVFFSKSNLGNFASANLGVTGFYRSTNGIAFSSYFDDLYYRLSDDGVEIGRLSQI